LKKSKDQESVKEDLRPGRELLINSLKIYYTSPSTFYYKINYPELFSIFLRKGLRVLKNFK